MADWDYATFLKNLKAEVRSDGGVLTGPMAGRPIMILTTTGAKTGLPREAIATFSRDGEAYVVAGSKGGAPEDPHWFTNLRANPIVKVETEGKAFEARADVAAGTDRDALWNRHVARNPEFGEYPSKTERIIPMARLTPVG